MELDSKHEAHHYTKPHKYLQRPSTHPPREARLFILTSLELSLDGALLSFLLGAITKSPTEFLLDSTVLVVFFMATTVEAFIGPSLMIGTLSFLVGTTSSAFMASSWVTM